MLHQHQRLNLPALPSSQKGSNCAWCFNHLVAREQNLSCLRQNRVHPGCETWVPCYESWFCNLAAVWITKQSYLSSEPWCSFMQAGQNSLSSLSYCKHLILCCYVCLLFSLLFYYWIIYAAKPRSLKAGAYWYLCTPLGGATFVKPPCLKIFTLNSSQ